MFNQTLPLADLPAFLDRNRLRITDSPAFGVFAVEPDPNSANLPAPDQSPISTPAAPAGAAGGNPKRKVPLAQLAPIAAAIASDFAPYCQRIQIAGSIRRKAEFVSDIELVCIDTPANALHAYTDQLLNSGRLAHRRDKNGRKAWGQSIRRALWCVDGAEYPLDIFFVTPDQWGGALAIRTGPSAFSHAIVTKRGLTFEHEGEFYKGLCNRWITVKNYRATDNLENELLETPEEARFFAALGVTCFSPALRTNALLKQLSEAQFGILL